MLIRLVLLAAVFPFCLWSCQDIAQSETASTPQTTIQPAETVEIGSLDELMALFDRLNYTSKSWAEGNREVPRLVFDNVSEQWKTTSNEIPVTLKKQVFFRLMAPLVLMANEQIMVKRQQIENSRLDDPALKALAVHYRVISDTDEPLEEAQRQTLLLRVDILPPSLVLAQAAEESGWGSSRFTIEGNSFFGQWDFSGKGMVPAQQRKELGNYGLARFKSPLASVKGYLHNLNTHQAYAKLRKLRARMRAKNQLISGYELAGTLDKYSERGQDYIDGLREMMRYNRLGPVDEAYLSDSHVIRLVTKGNE